jgi:hypothetical protein
MAPIDRPQWGGDGSGRSSGVAVTDDDAGDNVVSLPARTDKREPRAPVVRPDWSQSDNLPAPTTNAPPATERAEQRRDPDGRFAADPLGHLDPELRERWDAEGGAEYHMQQAQGTAMRILGAVSDPEDLSAHFDTLPQSIQNKVFDVLRLSQSKRTTANDLLLTLELLLTPDELATARTWVRQLAPEHHEAIIAGLGGSR